MGKIIDLTGQRFGKLLIVGYSGKKSNNELLMQIRDSVKIIARESTK
jgi:hypothetical protein